MARIVDPASHIISILSPEFALLVLQAVSRLERAADRRKVSQVLVRS